MTNHELEQQFQSLAEELLQNYQTVQKALRQMDENSRDRLDLEQLSQINVLMEPVKQTESMLAPIREQMQSMGMTAPDCAKSTIDKTIEIVSYLLPRVGELEKSARESRQKLAPAIGESVRAMKMQSAYARRK